MLRWRHKTLHKQLRRYRFWAKLLYVSLLGHIVFLFSLLFMYKGDYFSYNVTVSRMNISSGAPVIFLPFHKVVSKSPAPKKKQSVAKQKQKQAKKATVVVQEKPKKKKEVKKIVEKKVAQKKSAPAPKKMEKPSVAQSVQKNIEQAPVYVGRVQMEALRMQDEMHAAMSEHFKPPVGLAKDLVCVLKILVDWNGTIKQTMVHESSGVLMYDISARTAVAHATAPKSTYGKEFCITFKQ